jgi:hypothetical protein
MHEEEAAYNELRAYTLGRAVALVIVASVASRKGFMGTLVMARSSAMYRRRLTTPLRRTVFLRGTRSPSGPCP